MKKSSYLLSVFILLQASLVLADPTGWSNDIRLVYEFDDAAGPRLVLDSHNNAHVVWTGRQGNDVDIYYQKFTSAGLNTTPVIAIANLQHSPQNPALAVDQHDNIHLVWSDVRIGDQRIFYKKFNNNGINLTADIQLSDSYWADYPKIAVDKDKNIHVVWQDDDILNNTERIMYKKLDYMGVNLTADIPLTPPVEQHYSPSFTLDHEGNIHAIWHNLNGLFYKKLDNNGMNLTDILHIYNRPTGHESIVTDSNNDVHIVWAGGHPLHYIKLDQSGMNLTPVTRLTPFSVYFPSIAIDNSDIIHISFMTSRNIYYLKMNAVGNMLLPSTQITIHPNTSAVISSLTADLYGNIHVAWDDLRDGNKNIYYKHSLPPQLTVEGDPHIGNLINISLSHPLSPNTNYLLMMALGTEPAYSLGDGRFIPLNKTPGGLLHESIYQPQELLLSNSQSKIDASGQAVATWQIPNIPELAGWTVSFAWVTLDVNKPLPQSVQAISPAETITLVSSDDA